MGSRCDSEGVVVARELIGMVNPHDERSFALSTAVMFLTLHGREVNVEAVNQLLAEHNGEPLNLQEIRSLGLMGDGEASEGGE